RLARGVDATGRWRGELVRRYGLRNSLRFFAPPVLVLAVLVAIVVAALQATRVLTGAGALLAWVAHLPIVAYGLLVLGVAAGPGGGRGWRAKRATVAGLPPGRAVGGPGVL